MWRFLFYFCNLTSDLCNPLRAIFARPVTDRRLYPRTALLVLTALNLLNYADRNVLFAVQPLVQDEFHLSKVQIGYLTSAFLGFT